MYVRGVQGKVQAFNKLDFNVRKFNGIGDKIPVSVSISNNGEKAASYDFVLLAGAGFTPVPASFNGFIEPGKTAKLEAEITPPAKISGTLFRTRIAGTLDGNKMERVAQFAVGEGAGTIPYAKNPIKLDGETDDWGDLSKTVPLIQLADFRLKGFIPFDEAIFPAGEWKADRAVKLAFHILDRDDPALLGKGYDSDFAGLEWGATWVDANTKKEQMTFADTTGWKILILEK